MNVDPMNLCPFQRRTLALVLILMTLLLQPAVPARADRIDDLVRSAMETQRIPGLSLAVVVRGKVVRLGGYGFANLEHQIPAAQDTVYQIGSITKPFTALGILLLQEEGRLRLEDSVGQYVAEAPEDWRRVTLRQLLQHSAGVPSEIDPQGFPAPLPEDFTPLRMLSMIRQPSLEFEPDTRRSYSNMGYFLLGLVIEKVSGMGYAAYLEERVFRRLGMAATRVNSLDALVPRRASGYKFPGEYQNWAPVDPRIPYAAGAIVSSVEDLARWDLAMDAHQLIPCERWEESWTASQAPSDSLPNTGLGWMLDVDRGRQRIFHPGGIPGFSSVMVRYPDERVTVIVLCNQMTGLGGLATAIADSWLPQPKGTRPHVVTLSSASEAKSVQIAGSFNGWFPEPMKRRGGVWTARVQLPPERQFYKFVVDGQWILDPANPLAESDGRGNTNSVLERKVVISTAGR